MPRKPPAAASFDTLYPAVAKWTKGGGWIEVGYDDYSRSFVRVLDIGGMIWEGKTHYGSVDAALRAAEKAVARWYEENGASKQGNPASVAEATHPVHTPSSA